MSYILKLTVLTLATSLAACAQTGETERPDNAPTEAPTSKPRATDEPLETYAPMKSSPIPKKGSALPPPELTNGRYWLKNGPTALYDGTGKQLRILRNPGPYRIYETNDELVKISPVNNHWVKQDELSTETPNPRAWMNTTPPDRPVTQFPNALEEEAKRRGINVKDPKKD